MADEELERIARPTRRQHRRRERTRPSSARGRASRRPWRASSSPPRKRPPWPTSCRSSATSSQKLDETTIEIAAFGMVSRGKSSVLNALMGQDVFKVGATHGTTVARAAQRWQHDAPDRPGLEGAKLVVVDTPGIDEVGGEVREALARDVARHADLILFVVSGDMQRVEIEALSELREAQKPIILVFNQIDRYPDVDRDQIYAKIKDERVKHLVRPDDIVMTAARPDALQGQDPAPRRHDADPVGTARALDRAAQGPDPRRARARGQGPGRPEYAADRRRPARRDRRPQDPHPRRCRQPPDLELRAGHGGRRRLEPDPRRRHRRRSGRRRRHDRRPEQGLRHPA